MWQGFFSRDEVAALCVTTEAAEALGAIADPRAIPVLVRRLSSRARLVRRYCAAALGQIRGTGAPLRRRLRVERDA